MKTFAKIIALVLVVTVLGAAAYADTYSDTFTPSVEQKGAPEASSEDVEEGYLVVVPISESEETTEYIRTELEEAYDFFMEAGSLEAAAPALVEVLEAMEDVDVSVDELVVRDLVYVGVDPVVLEQYKDKLIHILFEMGLEQDAFLKVMHFGTNEETGEREWTMIDDERVEICENGDVVVGIEEFGVFAFVVKKG